MRTARTTAGTPSQRPRRTETAPRTTPRSSCTGRSQDGVDAVVTLIARREEDATLGMENLPAYSVCGSARTKGSQGAATAASHMSRARYQRSRGRTNNKGTKASAQGLASADAAKSRAAGIGRDRATACIPATSRTRARAPSRWGEWTASAAQTGSRPAAAKPRCLSVTVRWGRRDRECSIAGPVAAMTTAAIHPDSQGGRPFSGAAARKVSGPTCSCGCAAYRCMPAPASSEVSSAAPVATKCQDTSACPTCTAAHRAIHTQGNHAASNALSRGPMCRCSAGGERAGDCWVVVTDDLHVSCGRWFSWPLGRGGGNDEALHDGPNLTYVRAKNKPTHHLGGERACHPWMQHQPVQR